ncbi:MAG: hypothetical protein QXS89_07115 [Sulfolobales archaeon]
MRMKIREKEDLVKASFAIFEELEEHDMCSEYEDEELLREIVGKIGGAYEYGSDVLECENGSVEVEFREGEIRTKIQRKTFSSYRIMEN